MLSRARFIARGIFQKTRPQPIIGRTMEPMRFFAGKTSQPALAHYSFSNPKKIPRLDPPSDSKKYLELQQTAFAAESLSSEIVAVRRDTTFIGLNITRPKKHALDAIELIRFTDLGSLTSSEIEEMVKMEEKHNAQLARYVTVNNTSCLVSVLPEGGSKRYYIHPSHLKIGRDLFTVKGSLPFTPKVDEESECYEIRSA